MVVRLLKNLLYLKNNTDPERIDSSLSFKDLIERVEWNMNGIPCCPDGSLTPDIISVYDKDHFYILDAKYYLIKVNKFKHSIENQPGVQDVLKQFAYERAFNDFLKDYKFYYTVNAFLLPSLFSEWNDKEDEFVKSKGFVNFKLMQTSAYNNLGALQVLEINPNIMFNKFLQRKSCLPLLTKLFEKQNLLHHINRRITQDGTDTGLTLIGYIRDSYAEQINENNTFMFYFYEHKEFSEIEIHPEILRCTKFIGLIFNKIDKGIDSNKIKAITGTVKPEIKKVSSEELDLILQDKGIVKEHNAKVSFYYCMTIENAKKKEISQSQLSDLEEQILSTPGNYLLREHAPKVIYNEQTQGI